MFLRVLTCYVLKYQSCRFDVSLCRFGAKRAPLLPVCLPPLPPPSLASCASHTQAPSSSPHPETFPDLVAPLRHSTTIPTHSLTHPLLFPTISFGRFCSSRSLASLARLLEARTFSALSSSKY